MALLAGRRRLSLTLCALVVCAVAAAVVSVHAAAAKRHLCSYGVSSIGPVTIVNGAVVGGSRVPRTQACLP